jgi:hypothetical protein
MQALLNDFDTEIETTAIPGISVHGLFMVTTPIKALKLRVGDVVRVMYISDNDVAWCYLMSRASTPKWPSSLREADEHAQTQNTFKWVPASHLWSFYIPRATSPNMDQSNMEPFLTKSDHLVPQGGWKMYLEGSGVQGIFKNPTSWQFWTQCWGGDSLAGKTGGLHMTMNPDMSRRCQLSVEAGVGGDSLIDTIPGSRAGILLYLPTMSILANGTDGQDVCYDSTLTLTFSALVILYAETISIVRREIYKTPQHPMGGQPYSCMKWDFAHVPFSSPWLTSSAKKNINIHEYAKERARAWLRAEVAASPDSWKPRIPTSPQPNIEDHEHILVRTQKRGINRWEHTTKKRLKTTPETLLCLRQGTMVYI